MKNIGITLLSLLFLSLVPVNSVKAQDDETRRSTGLPMLIGSSVNKTTAPLSGKITVQGLDPSQARLTILVSVYFSGALLDKRQVNDAGFYFFPEVPREAGILVVEVNGVEAGRYQIPSSISGNIRQDLIINWAQKQNTKTTNAVVSVKIFYKRTDENEKLFEKAVLAAKEKNPDNAFALFKLLVKNDPKDFAAWTELGTLLFKNEKFSEAEDSYTKALEQKPDFMVALVNLGKLYLARKQADKAILPLTRAVVTESASADAQHYLGEAYLQTKKGSKAVIYLYEAIRLAPIEKAEIHLRIAALYNAANLKDKAVEEYKLFLEKVPTSG